MAGRVEQNAAPSPKGHDQVFDDRVVRTIVDRNVVTIALDTGMLVTLSADLVAEAVKPFSVGSAVCAVDKDPVVTVDNNPTVVRIGTTVVITGTAVELFTLVDIVTVGTIPNVVSLDTSVVVEGTNVEV